MIRPHCESTNGVSAVPPASKKAPSTMTLAEPHLSATAPNTGWAAPQTNWPMAMAKLIEAIPRPVEVLIGDMNKPVVKRAPMVIIRMAEAARISIQAARGDMISLLVCMVRFLEQRG